MTDTIINADGTESKVEYCEICNEYYVPKSSTQRFCSKKCRDKYYTINRKPKRSFCKTLHTELKRAKCLGDKESIFTDGDFLIKFAGEIDISGCYDIDKLDTWGNKIEVSYYEGAISSGWYKRKLEAALKIERGEYIPFSDPSRYYFDAVEDRLTFLSMNEKLVRKAYDELTEDERWVVACFHRHYLGDMERMGEKIRELMVCEYWHAAWWRQWE